MVSIIPSTLVNLNSISYTQSSVTDVLSGGLIGMEFLQNPLPCEKTIILLFFLFITFLESPK